MARAFRRKGGRFVATLDVGERTIVAALMEQTRTLLAPDVASTGDPLADLFASLERELEAPDGMPRGTDRAAFADRDPALARLLPDGHSGGPQVGAQFRRRTEQDLRRRKTEALTAAIDALAAIPEQVDTVSLDRPQADALLVALTDTRLLLAERLGVRTEDDMSALEARVSLRADELGHKSDDRSEDPLTFAVAVYDFLTWLQESLAGTLLGRRLFL